MAELVVCFIQFTSIRADGKAAADACNLEADHQILVMG